MRLIFLITVVCSLTACDYTEVEREIGYKGKARFQPWLAAERFVQGMGGCVHSVASWTPPSARDAVWILPAATLNNESFTRRMEQWVTRGGHLILLVEHADSERSDWSDYSLKPDLHQALYSMLERAGIQLDRKAGSGGETTREEIKFSGRFFKVNAKSSLTVSRTGKNPGVFVSKVKGDGRITVLTDGRILRNRWIGENEHADLLAALISATGARGNVGFMRGSPVSLWAMLREYLGPVLIGLAVWVLLWLWKSLRRFGPLESEATPQESRGYGYHLEALGDFQWRLDRGASLLAPLRAQITELGQRAAARVHLGNGEFYQYLADRSGLSLERVHQALADVPPDGSAQLTITAADLQQLHKSLHITPRS